MVMAMTIITATITKATTKTTPKRTTTLTTSNGKNLKTKRQLKRAHNPTQLRTSKVFEISLLNHTKSNKKRVCKLNTLTRWTTMKLDKGISKIIYRSNINYGIAVYLVPFFY